MVDNKYRNYIARPVSVELIDSGASLIRHEARLSFG